MEDCTFANLKMKYRCPKCGELFEGKVAECPHCHQVFAWPSDKNNSDTKANKESEQSSLTKVENNALSTNTQVKNETNIQTLSNDEQENENRDVDEKTVRQFEIKITTEGRKRGAKIALNVCWFIFYGLWATIAHFFTGILYFVSLIGIPFGIQVFKFLKLISMPFNKNVATKFNRSAGSIIGNILWLIFGLNFVYLIICGIFYVIFRITIVGYPLAVQCVKIMKFLCAPFGAEIVEDGQFSKNKDTAYDQGLIDSATLRFAMENTELCDQLLEDMDDKNLDHIYNAGINYRSNVANPLPAICNINNNYPFSPKYENILPKKFRRENGNKIGKSLISAFFVSLAITIVGIVFFVLSSIYSDLSSIYSDELFYSGENVDATTTFATTSLIFLIFGILFVILAATLFLSILSEVLFERNLKYRVYTCKYLYTMQYLDDKIIDKYIANKPTTINGTYVVEDLRNISPEVDATFAGRLLKGVKRQFALFLIFSILWSVVSVILVVIISFVTHFYALLLIDLFILAVSITTLIRQTIISKSAINFLNGFIKR